ncbi:MAG: hypothetical protein ND866_30685 [Pyrinomonadaceae bacterium]|nr:hypothetical protein [Pyrinomonadaceae bacterium]
MGFPLAALGVALAAAFMDDNYKACGYEGREYFNPSTGQYERDKTVYFVKKGEPCP